MQALDSTIKRLLQPVKVTNLTHCSPALQLGSTLLVYVCTSCDCSCHSYVHNMHGMPTSGLMCVYMLLLASSGSMLLLNCVQLQVMLAYSCLRNFNWVLWLLILFHFPYPSPPHPSLIAHILSSSSSSDWSLTYPSLGEDCQWSIGWKSVRATMLCL